MVLGFFPSQVKALDMEVCCTLGMLTKEQVTQGHIYHHEGMRYIRMNILHFPYCRQSNWRTLGSQPTITILTRQENTTQRYCTHVLWKESTAFLCVYYAPSFTLIPSYCILRWSLRGPMTIDWRRLRYRNLLSFRLHGSYVSMSQAVRSAGLSVCCGGILGLGESHDDRVGLLHSIATLPSHPESVPINSLVPIEGTFRLIRYSCYALWMQCTVLWPQVRQWRWLAKLPPLLR